MSTVMKASEFVKKLKDVANNYKTLYVMGCFGAPMNAENKERYCNNDDYNKSADRRRFIRAASTDTFGFDCVCLIKGILWGWIGDKNKRYGGAKYAINGVPDIGANTMIKKCSKVSTDFSKVEVGEALWCKGHIGVYIGNGLAVECTPSWKNCVQITAVKNIGTKAGYNARTWTSHGFLPYIEYDVKAEAPSKPTVTEKPAASSKPTTTNKPATSNTLKYSVGKIVKFTGGKQYASSDAASTRSTAKAGRAKVTAISKVGKHPYHLRAVNSSGQYVNGVYGWVDADQVKSMVTVVSSSNKVEGAQKKDSSLAGSYKVMATSGLNIRAGAGTTKKSIGVLSNGAVVNNYGFYSVDEKNSKWLYIKTKDGLIGFCHSAYLKKF